MHRTEVNTTYCLNSSKKFKAEVKAEVKAKVATKTSSAKAIYGFFHIATMPAHANRWESIVDELIGHLKESQLLGNTKLFTQVYLGPKADKFANQTNWLWSGENVKAVSAGANLRLYEGPTLKELWEKCNETEEEFYVYYFHTKGASYRPNNKSAHWRHIMTDIIILNWRRCVELLDAGEVTCGIRFSRASQPHYSGNFWWAKASHIRTLEKPSDSRNRFYFENWLSPPIRCAPSTAGTVDCRSLGGWALRPKKWYINNIRKKIHYA